MTQIKIKEELQKTFLSSDKFIAMCVAAGRNEPTKSSTKSVWNTIGFYLPPRKNEVLKTYWRH